MKLQKVVPLSCKQCGAPLDVSGVGPAGVTCEYCSTQYEPVQRHTGPVIPFDEFPAHPRFHSQRYGSSGVHILNVSNSSIPAYGGHPYGAIAVHHE